MSRPLDFFAKLNKSKFLLFFNVMVVIHFFIFWILIIIIYWGGIILNPGHKKSKSYGKSSLCHWNLSSIAAHDFFKFSLPEAYNTQYVCDIICLSEIYLHSLVSYGDSRWDFLAISWLELTTWATIKKVVSVFITRKHLLFDQYLLTSWKFLLKKKIFLLSLCRSASQSKYKFYD